MSPTNMHFVKPKTYLIGQTQLDMQAINAYLLETQQSEFLEDIQDAHMEGLSDGEIMCSLYAKMCYKALTTKHNKNITKVREISENVKGTLNSGHGSVFEHFWLNFITTNCSRVFTHELVRHRVGTAFSQTSGRYVRVENMGFVHDPILDPVIGALEEAILEIESNYKWLEESVLKDVTDFAIKKKLTSALRRMLPNGQANEIGWSINIRSLRHLIMLRTNRHAEWEIRKVFHDVYLICKTKFPLLFFDAKEEMVDNHLEITGMKIQPYE